MQTTDTGLLFQSDAQIGDDARRMEKLSRTRELGEPLILSSKVLASCLVGDTLWTAESGWQARMIDLVVCAVDVCLLIHSRAPQRCCIKATEVRSRVWLVRSLTAGYAC